LVACSQESGEDGGGDDGGLVSTHGKIDKSLRA
jgi:hypothetical protein